MDIDGEKVLLVGNRGHKNMGDEIILVGNIKILLALGKKIYVACSNKDWLKSFHSQFFKKKLKFNLKDLKLSEKNKNVEIHLKANEKGFYNLETNEQVITYVYELPKGFRSLVRFIKNFKDIKKLFEVDAILVGGGEILTEETPFSYFYWFLSVWLLLPFKKLYLSGGIQIPKKIWNKIIFYLLLIKSKKIYVRDYDLFKSFKRKDKLVFFPDTSFYCVSGDNNFILDFIKYKWIYNEDLEKKNYIVVNLNKKADKFYDKMYGIINKNMRYDVYFARICKSPSDDDIVYFNKLKKDFSSLKLLVDRENFYEFLKKISSAQKVYTTRLHLFLVAFFLGVDVKPFTYQKKVKKLKEVFNI